MGILRLPQDSRLILIVLLVALVVLVEMVVLQAAPVDMVVPEVQEDHHQLLEGPEVLLAEEVPEVPEAV
jgi:hypothetical protein